MAVSRDGKNGKFTGKVGRTVIYLLNGQWVERTIGENNKPPTDRQKGNLVEAALVTELLKPTLEFVRIGFALATKKTVMYPYHLATSLNRKHAIVGDYPNQEIDYTKAVFSKGTLPLADHLKVELQSYGVDFTWDTGISQPGTKSSDQVMVMGYCPEKRFTFINTDGERRKDGLQQLKIPKYQEKMLYHFYLSFISSNKLSISDSAYIGSLLY